MAGDAGILRKCTMGKQSSDLHTANLTQAIVDRFLREGLLDTHLPRICAGYGQQLNRMLSALASFPEGTLYTKPDGGLFIWVELPAGIDTKELLAKAVERHVAYVPGTHFYALGGHENTLRLNFSNSSLDQIDTGMDVLRDLFRSCIG
ncbi:MAG: hypothetical protein IJ708_04415 [Clostridia bacterium]|nr:hypothetical protein [Clostridia bacterium]